MNDFLAPDKQFNLLSLKDLLEARDHYHVHLMHKKNVVGTALGRYRIRVTDPWPTREHPRPATSKVKKARTLENSEVRPYSWPCVLVFVESWAQPEEIATGDDYHPEDLVPRALYLPDGRVIPACVVEAPRDLSQQAPVTDFHFPVNNIGGGFPVLAEVQAQEHVASIGCLVSDGHKYYALTNRHVCGEPGEVLYSRLDDKKVRIGVSAARQLTRLEFQTVYADWPGKNVYVNLDVGLIEVDDLEYWTAEVRDVGIMGPLADLSIDNLSLKLIGCPVRAYGSASHEMRGEIQALFYRYKSVGGFEYVADFLIGGRSVEHDGPRKAGRSTKSAHAEPFATHPGDSGTLWLLELPKEHGKDKPPPPMPLAVQWGAHVFMGKDDKPVRSCALATCLSTVCNLLQVDPVRDWNLDQPDTWGSVGHYSIAAATAGALSDDHAKLKKLMANNRTIISYEDDVLKTDDFKGQTEADFVPLADVPDNVWKHGTQGFSRKHEGPNHFADMDQKDSRHLDLLKLCQDPANISPQVWDDFYESVRDPLSGEKIAYEHRGLLPFRVWQIFDAMVGFVNEKQFDEFVCAAGVLAHYVGDACQPLHISYLHDGDPEDTVTKMVYNRHTHQKEPTAVPRAAGVHSMYETKMVGDNREAILEGLKKTPTVKANELIGTGRQAAEKVVKLMRNTFQTIDPADIVQAWNEGADSHGSRSKAFWAKFGKKTIQVMQDGTHLLAVLWESAWKDGGGEAKVKSTDALTEKRAKEIYEDRDFVPSCYINEIGEQLKE
jgi:hypothetical protein